jgi:hypothetical protein
MGFVPASSFFILVKINLSKIPAEIGESNKSNAASSERFFFRFT